MLTGLDLKQMANWSRNCLYTWGGLCITQKVGYIVSIFFINLFFILCTLVFISGTFMTSTSVITFSLQIIRSEQDKLPGGGYLGHVPLASQNPYPIIVYYVANYRPHLSHFSANAIVISRTKFNASRLLNIKITAGTIFQPRIFLFLNPYLPDFSYPENPENLLPHSSNSTKNVTPL